MSTHSPGVIRTSPVFGNAVVAFVAEFGFDCTQKFSFESVEFGRVHFDFFASMSAHKYTGAFINRNKFFSSSFVVGARADVISSWEIEIKKRLSPLRALISIRIFDVVYSFRIEVSL